MSNLMLHAGGRVATIDDVRDCTTPAASGRWHPTAHATVLDSVRETLTGAGYIVRAEKYALARNDQRFFGILDLETPLVTGVSLSVGVRNSFPSGKPHFRGQLESLSVKQFKADTLISSYADRQVFLEPAQSIPKRPFLGQADETYPARTGASARPAGCRSRRGRACLHV
jgi:hypothetical protein